jgi:hypothetical protein
LFGTEPDARVWALVNEAAAPTTHRVLDIGAGTRRNTRALARRGHPVDVVEVTPKFAELIRADAQREFLDIRVIQRDAFATMDDLRQTYELILLSEVVSDFRTTRQLRAMLTLAAVPGSGRRLVSTAFLAHHGYTPDNATRELGQQMYASILTRPEMSTAAAELPLQRVADDPEYEYEVGAPARRGLATDRLVLRLGEWTGRVRRRAAELPGRDALARVPESCVRRTWPNR